MIPNMIVNITCIHVGHYIILLIILGELSGGRMGEGKEVDEKELMHMREDVFLRILLVMESDV